MDLQIWVGGTPDLRLWDTKFGFLSPQIWGYATPELGLWTSRLGFVTPQVWVCGPLGLDVQSPRFGLVDPSVGVEDSQVWFYGPPGLGLGLWREQLHPNTLFLRVWVCSAVAELVLHSRRHQEKPRWVCCALCIVEFCVLPRNNPIKTPSLAVGCFVVKTEGQSQPHEIPHEPLVLSSSLLNFWCCRDFVPSLLGTDPSGQSLDLGIFDEETKSF